MMDKSLQVCTNYIQFKNVAMLSVKRNLKLKVNDSSNNKVNNYLQSSWDSQSSGESDSECDCDSVSSSSGESDCEKEIKYYLKNKANISFDISSLYLSSDLSNILKYWQYRFSSVDLVVVYKFKSVQIGTQLSQLLGKPLFILERDEINNTYKNTNHININQIIQNQINQNNNDKPCHVLIMNEVLKEGKSLASCIEFIRKYISNNQLGTSLLKISTTAVASIKSMKGKEHIYERYNSNDVSVDTIFEI